MSRLVVEVRPARPEDANAMCRSIRHIDRLEATLAYGRFSDEIVLNGIESSDWCEVGLVDGRLATMFGVACHNPLCGIGTPWFIATDVAEEVKAIPGYRHLVINFLRQSRKRLEETRHDYTLLENFVYARHRAAIRWLEWLGFTIEPPQPMGPKGAPFRRFSMRTDDQPMPDLLPGDPRRARGGRPEQVVDGEGVPGAREVPGAHGEGR